MTDNTFMVCSQCDARGFVSKGNNIQDRKFFACKSCEGTGQIYHHRIENKDVISGKLNQKKGIIIR